MSSDRCDVQMSKGSCGRTVVRNGRCIFHVKNKSKLEAERFKDEFLSYITRSLGDAQLEIVDCTSFVVPEIEMKLSSQDTKRVFAKLLVFRQADVSGYIIFEHATFNGNAGADFAGSKFSENAVAAFRRATFNGNARADFKYMKFNGNAGAIFWGATFNESAEADFNDAKFDQNAHADFWGATFKGNARANFLGATFNEYAEANFGNARFKENAEADFMSTKFNQNAGTNFWNARFSENARATFSYAKFYQNAWANFPMATFNEDAEANFDNAEFSENAKANFEHARFMGKALGDFRNAVLSKSIFASLQIEETAKIRFGALQERPPQDLSTVQFLETDVRLVDFGNVSWGIKPAGSVEDERHITTQRGPSYEHVVLLYRRLRQNYESQLRCTDAANFFVREMELLRCRPRHFGEQPSVAWSFRHVRDTFASMNRRVAWDYNVNLWRLRKTLSILNLYYRVAKYGESYQRVIAVSAFSILAYALYIFLVEDAKSIMDLTFVELLFRYGDHVVRAFRLFFQVFEAASLSLQEVFFRLWSGLLLAVLYISLRRKLERKSASE